MKNQPSNRCALLPRGPHPSPLQALAFCLIGLLSLASLSPAAPPPLTGDRLETTKGDLIIHPIHHATLALGWNNLTLYVDPVGGAQRFAELPKPDLILITHIHGDHLDAETLQAVAGPETPIIGPPAVAQKLPAPLQKQARKLDGGEKTSLLGLNVEAIPAYNLTQKRLKYHPKNRDVGYLLTLGSKRVYISGDTEDIPEMRGLKFIEVAFLCMNLPYTMTEEQAAEAVRQFKPKIVYPYHCRGSDLGKFRSLVGTDTGVEVRIRDWYP